MENIERLDVLGSPVDAVTMDEALQRVENILESNKTGNIIVAVNPRKVVTAKKDSSMRNLLRQADLAIADGVGIVLAVRWLLGKKIKRVTGVDLMQNICELASTKAYKVFVFGATEEINKRAAENIKMNYPGICLAGRSNGYLSEKDMPDLINRINNSGAQIIFVALGSPKQEQFMKEYLSQLINIKICQGIGGTLDVVSGAKKRAPGVLRKLGIEFIFRLCIDLRRLPREKITFLFLLMMIKAKLNGKSQKT